MGRCGLRLSSRFCRRSANTEFQKPLIPITAGPYSVCCPGPAEFRFFVTFRTLHPIKAPMTPPRAPPANGIPAMMSPSTEPKAATAAMQVLTLSVVDTGLSINL